MDPVIPKRELMEQMRRFFEDKNRGISIKNFADLCGFYKSDLRDVFIYKKRPLSEYVQVRVSRALNAWKNGDVAVMRKRFNKYVQFRKQSRPRIARSVRIVFEDGNFRLKPGLRNLGDYSEKTLDEQIGRK